MSGDLFRKEVLDSRYGGGLGEIVIGQNRLVSVAALSAIAVVAAMGIALFVGGYSRKISVTGELAPDLGISSVVSPISGVVSETYLKEGQDAILGQGIMRVSMPRTTAQGTSTLSEGRALLAQRELSVRASALDRIEQLSSKEKSLEDEIRSSRMQLASISEEIETRQKQYEIAEDILTRYQKISEIKAVSIIQVKQQEHAALELRSVVRSLERQRIGLSMSIAQLEQSGRSMILDKSLVKADISRQLGEIDQARLDKETNGELLITAPVEGRIATRFVGKGQAVHAGQILVDLVPRGSKLQAELLVPSSAIGALAEGNSVLLRYRAFPYQKFGHQEGVVLRISRAAVSDQFALSPGQKAVDIDSFYKVIVSLPHQTFGKKRDQQLRPGMIVDAEILGERRKIYEWILEPVLSLTK